MKAVIFDLDDTLYPEITFVHSGFRTVARFLGERYGLDSDALFARMDAILQRDGRGQVFDTLLQSLGLHTDERVLLLVHLYRSHLPAIRLFDDAAQAIARLKARSMRLGVLTDGLGSVQRNKIAALGLAESMDAVVCTGELGRSYWKTSPVPYQIILELLQVPASEAIYVGDDPAKDFAGPKALGIGTVQVKRDLPRPLAAIADGAASPAELLVSSLREVLDLVG